MSMKGRVDKPESQLKNVSSSKKPKSQYSTVDGKKRTIEKQLHTRNVKCALEKRPEVTQLVNGGILKQGSVAGKIQGVAKQLESKMTKDAVNQGLLRRPDPTDLIDSGDARRSRHSAEDSGNSSQA